jgi:hypothetical protein
MRLGYALYQRSVADVLTSELCGSDVISMKNAGEVGLRNVC